MMSNTFRERKPLAWQLGAVVSASENLIANKGKHRGDFEKMPETLQNDFIKMMGLVYKVKAGYDSWLLQEKPDCLPRHLEKYSQTA